MLPEEVKELLYNNGQIDCGYDDDVKQSVFDLLEDLGFKLGFDRSNAYWRYAYYLREFNEVHMSMYDDHVKHPTVSAFDILDIKKKQVPVDMEGLSDWVEFFSCA